MSFRKIFSLAIAAAALLCYGCSTCNIQESYHFPGTQNGQVVNYYRVEVEGNADGEKLRYISGFFDENALNRYFNTFSQPDNGLLISLSNGSEQAPSAPELNPEEKRDPDPKGLGRKLVILLSQNSEAVAEQIGSIAESEAFATVVGRLLFKDQLAELEQDKIRAERLESVRDDAKADAKTLAAQVDPAVGGNLSEIQSGLLGYVNRVAAGLDAPIAFTSFQQAQTWLEQNRAALVGGEK